MKISIDTIRLMNYRYKCTGEIMPDGVDALVEKIGAQLGAVETVTDLSQKYQGIVIAKVVSCEPHPNADKLTLCKLDDGGAVKRVDRDKDGNVQVVCGAPNVRAGLLVAWLPPGTTVPSSLGKEPFVLEARELRGKVSNGMIASAHELALSDDPSGILEIADLEVESLPAGRQGRKSKVESQKLLKPGDDFGKEFGLSGHVIDIENKMFTHRPDCFGFLGVGRELAGIQHMAFKSPAWYTQQPKFPKLETSEVKFQVKNAIPKLVPRFTAIAMSDIRVGTSPTWLQVELAKVGARSINNIVDYANFFMLETGQPLHAYDADKLPASSLETRMSKKGEKLKLLNGKEVVFEDASTILITSGDRPVGIGGVMGGADTEVNEHTKNIIIECANFDMYSIRRTSMKYGLFTDAVTRFNKAQSPLQTQAVLAKIVDEIRKAAGGKVASKLHDYHHSPKKPQMVRVSANFVNDRLGLELLADDMQTLLTNVEFAVERTDNKDELKVTPPFWRTDIDIPEDIVEEVGRLYGYDHIPLKLPVRDLEPAQRNSLLSFKQRIRDTLAKGGANEVLTYSFVHGNLLDKVGQDRKQAFELSNALSPDLQYYRVSLTPSLLDKVHLNIKAGYNEFALFELNKTHIKGQQDRDDPKLPREFDNLALVVAAADKVTHQGAAYYEARYYLDYLVQSLGVKLRYEPLKEEPKYPAAAPYDYRRSARVYIDDKIIGLVGEFKRSVCASLKLPAYCAGFEIGLSPQLQAGNTSGYHPIPKYPSVQQDISLKVPVKLTHAEVFDFLQVNLELPEHAQTELLPLDIYQGQDKKHNNMTFRLTIASYQKTMTDAEVNSMLEKVAAKAKEKLEAERI